ncbi:MAG: glycosyltransferase [Nocardioides sp.]
MSDPQIPSVIGTVRQRLALRTRARTARESVTAARYARWRERPVVPRTVLYESFSGNGMLDNPEAIFRHLLTQPDMSDLRHIWVLDDPAKHPEVLKEFDSHPQVSFVKILSDAYYKALATSQYLVNNATFPQELAKRPEQTYLNTWHGIPLKHMGFDLPGGGVSSRNVTRNFLQTDFAIGACDFMTETMYRRAYRLQGIFRGAVIEEGHPRTDRQVEAVKDPTAVLELLEARGCRVDGRKVVLFAPTWRGDSFQDPRVNAGQLIATVKDLQKSLDPADHVVLLKVHQVIYDAVKKRVGDCDFLVPNSVPTNQTLAVADLLVTDYSSIFFDFLATGRPVVHYVPDLDDYRSGRGLYLDESDLPGPVCATMPELVDAVGAGLGAGASDRSADLAQVYNPKDDGSVCARVVDIVFRGHEEPYTVHRDFGTDKETLLVYLGSLKTQGITTSALNLLHNLDYDRYDVTAFYTYSKGRDRLKNAALVDERARIIPRAVQFNGSPARVRRETKKLMEHGLPEQLSADHVKFWTDEWQRVFGQARFDHLIDFSGYGCYSPFLFSVTEAKHKSIWLHNDMYADMQRETVGEKHLEDRLQAVFTTYKYFDHLVSVSPALEAINRTSLADFAPPERFTHAVNTIDGERILELSGLTAAQAAAKADGGDVEASGPRALVEIDSTNLTSAMSVLLDHFAVEDVLREARGRLRLSNQPAATAGTVTFVTIGRLSPPKNHTRMIKAFATVHERNPHIRLVIMGYGPLEQELQALINSLGMESAITLAGLVDNPYALLAQSDCFVLSSDYEGQPMVILEARTLGLPVVTTAFSSVSDAVPEGAGLVVPQSVKGVASGLQAFLDGSVPAEVLDTPAYNAQAMAQFDAAIHHRPGA